MAEQRITRGKRVWNKSMASYLQALHDHQEFMIDYYQQTKKAMDAELGPNPSKNQKRAWMEKYQIYKLEAEGDRLANIMSAKLRLLISTPSPTYSDLVTKMQIAQRNEFTSFYDAAVIFEIMLDDLKRLIANRCH